MAKTTQKDRKRLISAKLRNQKFNKKNFVRQSLTAAGEEINAFLVNPTKYNIQATEINY